MKQDIEEVLSNVVSILQESLNTKIAAIEAEKTALGKPVGLPSVDAAAYFEQSWSDKILNYSPAIFYGLEEVTATGEGPATAEIFKIFVEIILVDSGLDTYTSSRIHRYARALKEVFEENFDKLSWGNKIKIETVRPVSFKLDVDSSDEIKVGGVSITTALA